MSERKKYDPGLVKVGEMLKEKRILAPKSTGR